MSHKSKVAFFSNCHQRICAWFDAKIKKKMDRKKTKLEVREVFPKWKKASIKLCTVLGNVFIPPNGKTKYEWFMEWFIVFSWFIITILSIILINISFQ